MRAGIMLLTTIIAVAPAAAQTAPAPSTGTSAGIPKNLDRALDLPMTIDASHVKLSEFADLLRDLTQTNVVFNWNALAQTGITRDTPVDLHLRALSYEHVVRTLVEVLPATGPRPNYTVGDNLLSFTTNADLGKGNVPRIFDVARAVNFTLESGNADTAYRENTDTLEKVLRFELTRSGETLDGKNHALAIKEGSLGTTLSARGQSIVERAVAMFNGPLKIGQLAAGTQLTALARKTQDTIKAIPPAKLGDSLAQMARDADKHPQGLNIALLPGTQEELAKKPPEIGYAISEGGVLLIGPRQMIAGRTVLAVYDLRDLIRRLNTRNRKNPAPIASEYQSAIVGVLQQSIHPDAAASLALPATKPAPAATAASEWGGLDDLGKKNSCLIPCNGSLIIIALPETHRILAAALQDIYK